VIAIRVIRSSLVHVLSVITRALFNYLRIYVSDYNYIKRVINESCTIMIELV